MNGNVDEGRFRELMVESNDLQSDAMRSARNDLNSYVEAAKEARYANAATASMKDVMALQTAAGIENLAVFTYKTALTLAYIGGKSAIPVVKGFCEMTMKQHSEHAAAFNAAVKGLGGKQQTGTDPKYTPIVQSAAGKLKGPADVVSLAITLEDVAAQTYTNNVGLVSTKDLRLLFSSVAGVEAQHRAILLAVQALVGANLISEIAIPTDVSKLPAAAGSVGFPRGFYSTQNAAPVAEGAVK
jgi:hypothetical protein